MATYVGLSSSLLIPYLAEFNAMQNLALAGSLARLQSGIINSRQNPEQSNVRQTELMLIEFRHQQ